MERLSKKLMRGLKSVNIDLIFVLFENEYK